MLYLRFECSLSYLDDLQFAYKFPKKNEGIP